MTAGQNHGRSFTVIVNPASGRGKTRKLLPRLEAALTAAASDMKIRISESPAHPPELAREAFAAGRVVVACGGDGLVGQLAGVAADERGTLAIIPTGSGNDFARNVGLDHNDPFAAVPILNSGTVKDLDLGRVNGSWFCCVASTGFDAEANRWANERKHLGGTALYIAATFRTLAIYRPKRFRITVDGDVTEMDAWLLAVGNATSYGGGMKVAPSAQLDDNALDATAVGPVSKFAFIRTFPKVFKGTHVDHPQVRTFHGSVFELASPAGEALPVFADGEHVADLPARIDVVPGALSLIAP